MQTEKPKKKRKSFFIDDDDEPEEPSKQKPKDEEEEDTPPEEIIKRRTTITEQQKKARHIFLTSDYTLDDYQLECATFTTKAKHEKKLAQCIAVLRGAYIVKYSDKESRCRFHQLKKADLQGGILDQFTWLGNGEQYKPISMSLQDSRFQSKLAHFSNVKMYSADDDVLSLFVPPSIKPEELVIEKVEDFIKFYAETRILNPEAFYEELSAHAFRFRHPNTNISKVFIHYTEEPNTGKTLLSSVLGSMYPHFSASGASATLLSDTFNDWITNALYIYFEELPSSEHKNPVFETFIKQLTSGFTMQRKKYADTKQAEYKVICALNTNESDLYGLITAGIATRSRLVILQFKSPAPTRAEWEAKEHYWGLLRSDPDYEHTSRVFAASLYEYLRTSFKNPYYPDLELWKPDRYEGKDRDKILNELSMKNRRIPFRFVSELKSMKSNNQQMVAKSSFSVKAREPYLHPTDDSMRILQTRIIEKEECIFVHTTSIEYAWELYPKKLANEQKYTSKAITDQLKSLGWSDAKYAGLRGYKIQKSEYEKWRRQLEQDPEATEDPNQLTDADGYTPEELAVRNAVRQTVWSDTEFQGQKGKFITLQQYYRLLSEPQIKPTGGAGGGGGGGGEAEKEKEEEPEEKKEKEEEKPDKEPAPEDNDEDEEEEEEMEFPHPAELPQAAQSTDHQ